MKKYQIKLMLTGMPGPTFADIEVKDKKGIYEHIIAECESLIEGIDRRLNNGELLIFEVKQFHLVDTD